MSAVLPPLKLRTIPAGKPPPLSARVTSLPPLKSARSARSSTTSQASTRTPSVCSAEESIQSTPLGYDFIALSEPSVEVSLDRLAQPPSKTESQLETVSDSSVSSYCEVVGSGCDSLATDTSFEVRKFGKAIDLEGAGNAIVAEANAAIDDAWTTGLLMDCHRVALDIGKQLNRPPKCSLQLRLAQAPEGDTEAQMLQPYEVEESVDPLTDQELLGMDVDKIDDVDTFLRWMAWRHTCRNHLLDTALLV